MAKKYYWLKLQKDFFKRHDVKVIESMENGKEYVIFYLKLLVESLSHEGYLRFSDRIPYNDKMLASVTNTNIDVVKQAVKLFSELSMMELLDDGTIFMTEVQNMLGEETDWAKKKRLYREKQEQLGHNKDNVPSMSDKSKSKSKSKSKNINTLSSKHDQIDYKSIVSYLNDKADTKYRSTSNKTQTLIKARVNDGFTVDDFKQVIDNKVAEWKGGDMEKYIRPETLFGTKFESYLNQKVEKKQPSIDWFDTYKKERT